MGIKNLNNLLRKNCPLVFEEIHLSEFSFSKVAVDISLFLCKCAGWSSLFSMCG